MEGQFPPPDNIISLAPAVAEVPEHCGWFKGKFFHTINHRHHFVLHFLHLLEEDSAPALCQKWLSFYPTFPAKNFGTSSGPHPYPKLASKWPHTAPKKKATRATMIQSNWYQVVMPNIINTSPSTNSGCKKRNVEEFLAAVCRNEPLAAQRRLSTMRTIFLVICALERF